MGGLSALLKDLSEELRAWRVRPTPREVLRARVADKEHPDPVPLEQPVDYDRPPSMQELVQQYVRQTVSQAAVDDGYGSFDEEDDFSEEGNYALLVSPYELSEYQMTDEEEVVDASPPEEPDPGPAKPAAEAPEEPEKPAAPAADPPQ